MTAMPRPPVVLPHLREALASSGAAPVRDAAALLAEVEALRLALLPEAPIREFLPMVAASFGVTVSELTGAGRDAELVAARRAVAVMAKRRGYSLAAIGRALCRDHGSVAHMLKNAGVADVGA